MSECSTVTSGFCNKLAHSYVAYKLQNYTTGGKYVADLLRHGRVLKADSFQLRLDPDKLFGRVAELVGNLYVASLGRTQLTSQVTHELVTLD